MLATLERPQIQFFHSFRLADGEVIDGMGLYETLKTRADTFFPDLKGKSVLDIGAWDGFFSFEAEWRGAARVMATDHFCWSGPGWGTREGFDYVHARSLSRVEVHDADLPDLTPAAIGKFDVVLFLGVLYHLKDPYAGLERAAALCNETLIVETAGAMMDHPEPLMRFYLGGELNLDGGNYWAPNFPCLQNMLLELGFKTIENLPSPDGPNRLLVRATR
jgi:tRNA (mo5U34)-methyltransferase